MDARPPASFNFADVWEMAADALGDVVYVDLPAVGDEVTSGDSCGEIESTKSVSDLLCPLTGEVVAINEALDASPQLVNSDPYGEGWLFEVEVEEVGPLMTADEYASSNGV